MEVWKAMKKTFWNFCLVSCLTAVQVIAQTGGGANAGGTGGNTTGGGAGANSGGAAAGAGANVNPAVPPVREPLPPTFRPQTPLNPNAAPGVQGNVGGTNSVGVDIN